MIVTIETKFNIKDRVYVITDPNQDLGIVTRIIISVSEVVYEVSRDSRVNAFWEFELTKEKILQI